MKPSFLLSALIIAAMPVCAQVPASAPDKPGLPTGPLLRAPTEFAKWEITSTFSETVESKAKALRHSKGNRLTSRSHRQTVVTTKTGRLIHEECAAQNATENWYEGAMQYSKAAGDTLWYWSDGRQTSKSTSDASYHPLPAVGYRDVDFITEANYAGTMPYNKRSCLVFVPGGANALDLNHAKDAPKKLAGIDTVAYVDAETRLPVEVRSHGETRVFQFDPPPKRMQTLPAELLAQIRKGDDARTRLNQPAPRPY